MVRQALMSELVCQRSTQERKQVLKLRTPPPFPRVRRACGVEIRPHRVLVTGRRGTAVGGALVAPVRGEWRSL